MTPPLALLTGWLLQAATGGLPLGYVRATSEHEEGGRPSLQPPLGLLDGREATAWCEGVAGSGVGEGVRVVFKRALLIDQVRVTTGDARTPDSFAARNRVTRLLIREETSTRGLALVDTRERQTIKLSVPLEVDSLFLEIGEVERGSGEDDVTCLTDVVFLSGGKALASFSERLAVDPGRALLAGGWVSGPPGAPDRFLDLYLDGTYRYAHRPFDPEERAVTLEGVWTLQGERLRLRPEGGAWTDVNATRAVEKEGGGERVVLDIAGEPFEGTLATRWLGRPIR